MVRTLDRFEFWKISFMSLLLCTRNNQVRSIKKKKLNKPIPRRDSKCYHLSKRKKKRRKELRSPNFVRPKIRPLRSPNLKSTLHDTFVIICLDLIIENLFNIKFKVWLLLFCLLLVFNMLYIFY